MNTQTQQALLQFVVSLILTSMLAGLVMIAPLLTSDTTPDWRQVSGIFAFAVLVSLAHGATAYYKPSSQASSQQTPLQGPLVVVNHSATSSTITTPQNSATTTIGQSSTSTPNDVSTTDVHVLPTNVGSA